MYLPGRRPRNRRHTRAARKLLLESCKLRASRIDPRMSSDRSNSGVPMGVVLAVLAVLAVLVGVGAMIGACLTIARGLVDCDGRRLVNCVERWGLCKISKPNP